MAMDMDKEETCRKFLLENGVKEKTIKKLCHHEILDLDTLLDFTDEQLKNEATLTMGERSDLQKALTIYRATPKVEKGPNDFSLLVGDDIQIECMISGTPTPKVTWCQGQKTLLADERYHMENTTKSATMMVAKARLKDSAQYTLRLDNGDKSAQFSVNVTVKALPRVMICNLEETDETEVKDLREILRSLPDRLELIKACGANEDINRYINENLEMCDFGLIKVPKTFQYAEGNIAAKLEWAARKENRKEVTRKLIPIYSKEGDEDSPGVKHLPLMLKIRPLYMHDSDGNKKSNEKFIEELLTYLNGDISQRIDDLYPQGLIATGLALSYFKPATILLSKEMDAVYDAEFQKLKKEHDAGNDDTDHELRKFTKTIIAVRADCKLPGRNDDPKQTHTMKLTIGNMHGIARDVTFNLYNIRIDKKIYLVRMDFPNIVTVLDKMTLGKGEEATYRKIDEPQRNQQRDDFVTETRTLLDVKHKDKYAMVVFTKETDLVDKIKSEIIKDNPGEKNKSLLEEILSQEMEAKFEEKFKEMEAKFEEKFKELKKSPGNEETEYKKMSKTIIAFTSDSGSGDGKAADNLKEVGTIFKVKLFEIRIEKEIYLVRVKFSDEKATSEEDMIKKQLDIRHMDKYVIISAWGSLDELEKKIEDEIIQSRNESEPAVIVYFEKEDTNTDFPKKNTEVKDLKKLETFEKILPKFGVKLLRGITNGRPEKEINVPPEGSDEVTLLIWVEKGKLSSFQKKMTNSSLYRQNKNNFKQVFAILADGEQMVEKDLAYFDSTTSFKYHAEGSPGYEEFMQTIFRICSPPKIPLTYPLADVHHGLVWAAALNYLKPNMPGKVSLGMKPWGGGPKKAPSLRQYCEQLKTEKFPDAVVFPKVILITEKLCRDGEGTVKHMTIGFKEDSTGNPPNKVQLKTALVKQLVVKEERLAITELEATPARYKVTLTRSDTTNNYEPDLTKILVRFADNVEKNGFVVENGEKKLEYKVSVAVTGKAFDDFEGIEECMITTSSVDGVTENLAKSITTGLFNVTYNKKVYLASFEFVRAVLCIGEIKNENLVPIAPEKMEEQVEEFNKLFKEQAYTIPEIRDHCELLTFDADDQANRDKLNELRLNKIIAQFIQARIEADPEQYDRLEKEFDPVTLGGAEDKV